MRTAQSAAGDSEPKASKYHYGTYVELKVVAWWPLQVRRTYLLLYAYCIYIYACICICVYGCIYIYVCIHILTPHWYMDPLGKHFSRLQLEAAKLRADVQELEASKRMQRVQVCMQYRDGAPKEGHRIEAPLRPRYIPD